jgi:hypothetical protein
VKISRGSGCHEKSACGFAGISAENPVGIRSAKEFLEIRLTDDAIQVEFANCPERKNKKTTTVNL